AAERIQVGRAMEFHRLAIHGGSIGRGRVDLKPGFLQGGSQRSHAEYIGQLQVGAESNQRASGIDVVLKKSRLRGRQSQVRKDNYVIVGQEGGSQVVELRRLKTVEAFGGEQFGDEVLIRICGT